ncbi:MAG: hypothetical protein QM731_24395 [Chitinophagaceae bacterium]
MKKFTTIQKAAILQFVLLFFIATGFAQQITIPVNLQKSIVNNRIPSHIQLSGEQLKKIMIKRIDLTASRINFTVTCSDKFNGVVKVEGFVKNTGGLAYTTNPGQQSALLYEDNGGKLQLVASQPFSNVAPGAEVKVAYTRKWNVSSPAEGEFPPKYVLVIAFDPDIYIDGNDNNDDSNNTNNRFTKSASEVNTTWPCRK